MENTDIDKATKEIMANSSMELTDPDFNRLVLHKIVRKRDKKIMLQQAFICFGALIAIEALVVILIRSLHPGLPVLSVVPLKLGTSIIVILEKARDFVMQNGYLVLPFIVVFMLKRIMEPKLRYS